MCNSGNKEARGRFFTEKLILKGVPHALKKATDFRRSTNKGYILLCSFTRRFLQRNHCPLSTGNNSGISKQEGFLPLVLQVTQVRDRATHTDTTVLPGEMRSGQLGNDSDRGQSTCQARMWVRVQTPGRQGKPRCGSACPARSKEQGESPKSQ